MKKLAISVITLLALALVTGAVGCGGDSDDTYPDIQILEACSQVHEGNGINQAAEYSHEPSSHPVVLLDFSGDTHKWTGKITEDWCPASIMDVELVVLVGEEEESSIETCRYSDGPDVTRYRYKIGVRLIEAKTGTVVDSVRLWGSAPRSCEEFEPVELTRLVGSHVSFEQLEDWLRPYVTGTPLAPTTSVEEVVRGVFRALETNDKYRMLSYFEQEYCFGLQMLLIDFADVDGTRIWYLETSAHYPSDDDATVFFNCDIEVTKDGETRTERYSGIADLEREGDEWLICEWFGEFGP